jgi:hypothetical protein
VVISTIGQASVFAGTVAISLWASAASSQAAAPVKGEVKYVPMESISYDFGSKSMSGYFVDQAASCVVTLMVYEKGDPDAAHSSTRRAFGSCSIRGKWLASTAKMGAPSTSLVAGERWRCSSTSARGRS